MHNTLNMTRWSYDTMKYLKQRLLHWFGISEIYIKLKHVNVQVAVFCVMTSCSDVLNYQCFGGPFCLHL